ncbi:MAG: L,D-transpeptidase [Candidatus Moranbacteria bacterium]|nr:L,D-transpeptidase [Candidatus Moranbacteria bacterium]
MRKAVLCLVAAFTLFANIGTAGDRKSVIQGRQEALQVGIGARSLFLSDTSKSLKQVGFGCSGVGSASGASVISKDSLSWPERNKLGIGETPGRESGMEAWGNIFPQHAMDFSDGDRSSVWLTGNPEENGFSSYTVQKGDTYSALAARMSPGHEKEFVALAVNINRIDEKSFPTPGKKILVPKDLDSAARYSPIPVTVVNPKGARWIVVYKDRQYLGAYLDGGLVFWFPVSTGANVNWTPPGNYVVAGKELMHHSKKHNNAPMPYSTNLSGSDYFIHQGKLPGKPASHGCVRSTDDGAKTCYKWTRKADPVSIVPTASDLLRIAGSLAINEREEIAQPFPTGEMAQNKGDSFKKTAVTR